jgi:hypothetical protein
VLIHRPGEKYDTALTRQLVSELRPLYRDQEKIGRFIVYWDSGGT